MEICMLGITKRDRKTNEWIRAKVEHIIKTAKKMKWIWAGHIARRIDGRWTTNILHWIPREKKRPRRRPNTRWVDEIKRLSSYMDEHSFRPRYVERKRGGLHPAVDRKRLNMMMIYVSIKSVATPCIFETTANISKRKNTSLIILRGLNFEL